LQFPKRPDSKILNSLQFTHIYLQKPYPYDLIHHNLLRTRNSKIQITLSIANSKPIPIYTIYQ
jgi:hypothetical protein